MAKFDSTKAFIKAIKAENIKFHEIDSDEEKTDLLATNFTDETNEMNIGILFYNNNREMKLFVPSFWEIGDSGTTNYLKHLMVVDKLNSEYRYIKLFIDSEDNLVRAQMDVYFPDAEDYPEQAVEICISSLRNFVNLGLKLLAEKDELLGNY